MRAHELYDSQLAEIEKMPAASHRGSKDDLLFDFETTGFRPLPGDSGLLYKVHGDQAIPEIQVWDPDGEPTDGDPPKQGDWEPDAYFQARLSHWEYYRRRGVPVPTPVGNLTLNQINGPRIGQFFPIKNAMAVQSITVDPDYRGRGIGKALYGIALSILKIPLVAGDTQTPGGRRNWVSLSQIPGVKVKGYVAFSVPQFEDENDIYKLRQQAVVRKIGGQYMGLGQMPYGALYRYFSFDVSPNQSSRELEAAIKQKMISVYRREYSPSPLVPRLGRMITGLYAVWEG